MPIEDYYCVGRAPNALVSATLHQENLPALRAQIAKQKADLSAAPIRSSSIEKIYEVQYQKHFGRRPRLKNDSRTQAIFSRVLALCLREHIDPATYISANMHGMKKWLDKNPRMAFQPNMLSGDKAHNRYCIYRKIAGRRCSFAEDACDEQTALGQLRKDLILGEEAVGGAFVSAWLHGRELAWHEAIVEATEHTALPKPWFDVTRSFRNGKPLPYRLRDGFSRDRLRAELRLATYSAAAAVGNLYSVFLQDQIGVHRFRWETFTDLLCRVRPKRKRRRFVGSLPRVKNGSLAWGSGK